LTNTEFQADIRAALDSFKPECVILDPWNAAARDDKILSMPKRSTPFATCFQPARTNLRSALSHTRENRNPMKRTGGTGLMHMLSGSYILTSAALYFCHDAAAMMRRMTQLSFSIRKLERR
jgi:hypothetical protein